MPRAVSFVAAVAAISAAVGGAVEAPYLVLDGSSDWELALNPSAGACVDVPDSMPIAWFNRATGVTSVISAHSDGTHTWSGATLDSVKHDCADDVFNSTFDTTPQSYANNQWLQSARLFRNGSAAALVHCEFHGEELGSQYCACQHATNRSCYNVCELWSTGLAQSHDGAAHFSLVAPPPAHLVAALPATFKYNQPLAGYGAISPMLQGSDGAFYGVINVAGGADALPPGQLGGNCPFRATNLFDPTSFRARDAKGGYSVQWYNPYLTNTSAGDGVCATISTAGDAPVTPHACFRRVVSQSGLPPYTVVGPLPGLGIQYAWSFSPSFEDALDTFEQARTLALDGVQRWVSPEGRVLYPVLFDAASPDLGQAFLRSTSLQEDGDNFLLVNGSKTSNSLYLYFVASYRNILRHRVRFSDSPPAPPVTPPPPPAGCKVFVVSDAGDKTAEGTYVRSETRTSDGLPVFELDEAHTLYRFNGAWRIGQFAVQVSYSSTVLNTTLPHSEGWATVLATAVPAPRSVQCKSARQS